MSAVITPCSTSYQLYRQCLRLVQLSNIYYIYTRTTEVIHSAVNLTSSTDRVCPGGSVVFTCVTDTGRLAWRINDNNHLYFSSGQMSQVTPIADIFTLKFISATGSVFTSTATAHNVSLEFTGSNITCSDSEVSSADTASQMKTIGISINAQVCDA